MGPRKLKVALVRCLGASTVIQGKSCGVPVGIGYGGSIILSLVQLAPPSHSFWLRGEKAPVNYFWPKIMLLLSGCISENQ